MTDNEIIKALECCTKTEFISDCAKCEMLAFGCKDTLIENAFGFVNMSWHIFRKDFTLMLLKLMPHNTFAV